MPGAVPLIHLTFQQIYNIGKSIEKKQNTEWVIKQISFLVT